MKTLDFLPGKSFVASGEARPLLIGHRWRRDVVPRRDLKPLSISASWRCHVRETAGVDTCKCIGRLPDLAYQARLTPATALPSGVHRLMSSGGPPLGRPAVGSLFGADQRITARRRRPDPPRSLDVVEKGNLDADGSAGGCWPGDYLTVPGAFMVAENDRRAPLTASRGTAVTSQCSRWVGSRWADGPGASPGTWVSRQSG